MEVEPARPAHEQPAPFLDPRARLGEQGVELDETRIHEQRPWRVEDDLTSLEGERVLDRDLRRQEGIAASRKLLDDVVATETLSGAVDELYLPAPLPFDALDDRHRPRNDPPLDVQLDRDGNIVAGHVVSTADGAA